MRKGKQGGSGGILSKQELCSQWKNSKQQVIQYEKYRMTTAELLQAVGKGVAACGLFATVFYEGILDDDSCWGDGGSCFGKKKTEKQEMESFGCSV